MSRRPDDKSKFHVVLDGGSGGFGYACSDDGLNWEAAPEVLFPGGVRTPFGLVPMTATEMTARQGDILGYGVLNKTTLNAPNTSLQWAFLTQSVDGESFEHFHASIVQVKW